MLKFMIDTNKRVPDPRQKVRSSCLLIVNHSSTFKKLPNESLKPAFKQLLNDGTFSDVVIHVGEHKLNAHKCILSTQSPVFKRIIDDEDYLANPLNPILAKETQNGGDLNSDEEETIQNVFSSSISSSLNKRAGKLRKIPD